MSGQNKRLVAPRHSDAYVHRFRRSRAARFFEVRHLIGRDVFGRVDRQYGRKLTIDLPDNGGRTSAAFWFINGRIISLQATVLPANGDYDTPDMARFVDSITFFTVRAPDEAIELPAPPK
jgi:hypothetical protein